MGYFGFDSPIYGAMFGLIISLSIHAFRLGPELGQESLLQEPWNEVAKFVISIFAKNSDKRD